MIPKKWVAKAKMFEAMGHPERQRILLLLTSPAEKLAMDLIRGSTLAQPSVSHHLSVLVRAKVLLRRKQGKNIYYRLNMSSLSALFSDMVDYLNLIKKDEVHNA